jgi:hypothetical protein
MRRTMIAGGGLLCAAFFLTGGVLIGREGEPAKKAVPLKEWRELMTKAHKGDDSPLGQIRKELQTDDPDWAVVGKNAEALFDLADRLRDDQPYGADRYYKSVHDLDAAAEVQDKTAATAALQGLRRSCASCHYGGHKEMWK